MWKMRGYNYNEYGVYSEIVRISSFALPRESNTGITATEVTQEPKFNGECRILGYNIFRDEGLEGVWGLN